MTNLSIVVFCEVSIRIAFKSLFWRVRFSSAGTIFFCVKKVRAFAGRNTAQFLVIESVHRMGCDLCAITALVQACKQDNSCARSASCGAWQICKIAPTSPSVFYPFCGKFFRSPHHGAGNLLRARLGRCRRRRDAIDAALVVQNVICTSIRKVAHAWGATPALLLSEPSSCLLLVLRVISFLGWWTCSWLVNPHACTCSHFFHYIF